MRTLSLLLLLGTFDARVRRNRPGIEPTLILGDIPMKTRITTPMMAAIVALGLATAAWTLNKAIGAAPGEATGAVSQPATAPATNQAPKTDAETADLQRAVGIGVSALHEQSQLPAEGFNLTS